MSIRKVEVKGIIKESKERADALSFNSIGAWWSSMQLLVHAESLELCSIFSNHPEQQTSFLSASCTSLCLGSRGSVLQTFTHLMSSIFAKHAKVVGKSVSMFLRGEFAILSEFIGEVGLLVLSGGTGQVRIGALVR